MVLYTQFSPSAISTDRAKLWNPSKTLEIINLDYGCQTCTGYAPSQRRRCRNPIRADNRALIERTLDEIAYLPPDSPAVMSKLRAIAGPALCVRWHQGQVETVVMTWQRKIHQLKPQIGERRPAKPVQSTRLQEPVPNLKAENLQDQLKELMASMAKLQEEVDSKRQQRQESEESEERATKDRQEEERRQRRTEERNREARRKESERLEKELLEQERLEKERLAKEKREKEEKQRREREAAAANERIRLRAQNIREEKEQKEREEWDQLWAKYQERWTQFKASASDSREGYIGATVPWPVKSGLYRDVKASNVREFFQKAVSRDPVKVLRKECLKWHPDRTCTWLRGARLSDVDEVVVGMICRVVTELLGVSAGRSSEFLG